MHPAVPIYAYVATLLISLLLAAVCLPWPNLGRALFALLFGWAGQFNLKLALVHPQAYVGFSRFAVLEAYRDFIQGWFAQHVAWVVVPIALGQLAICLLLLGPTRAVRLGCAGGIVFALAIAPLCAGSAFPASLVMALGLALLMRRRYARSLPGLVWERLSVFGTPPD